VENLIVGTRVEIFVHQNKTYSIPEYTKLFDRERVSSFPCVENHYCMKETFSVCRII